MKQKLHKRWWQIGLAVVLITTLLLGGCGPSTDPADALLDPETYYARDLYSWNGTAWVDTALGGGGGGGGLWQVAGGDTELIIADSLDIQSQFIHNVLDPVLNQDAATKIYVDTADTTLANADTVLTNDIATNATAIIANAAAIAVNVVNIAANFANIATNTADIASNATANANAIASNAADIASNATAIATNTANIATNTANIATNTADIASNASAFNDHSARHESGGADEIEVTYDICESYLAPYIMSRSLTRFMHIQFDSYDMIDEYTGGLGYVVENFYAPYVRSGATSGGWAVLCQNSEWLYVDRNTIFYQQGYYVSAARDGTGFIGITDSDNHVITKDDTVNHAGFVFYVSGATQTVYAQSGDTVACEQTDLSVDPATFASWAMISDGSHIYFYRNWVLVATHTTRIPAGALAWKISTISAENQDNAIVARNFVYGQIG